MNRFMLGRSSGLISSLNARNSHIAWCSNQVKPFPKDDKVTPLSSKPPPQKGSSMWMLALLVPFGGLLVFKAQPEWIPSALAEKEGWKTIEYVLGIKQKEKVSGGVMLGSNEAMTKKSSGSEEIKAQPIEKMNIMMKKTMTKKVSEPSVSVEVEQEAIVEEAAPVVEEKAPVVVEEKTKEVEVVKQQTVKKVKTQKTKTKKSTTVADPVLEQVPVAAVVEESTPVVQNVKKDKATRVRKAALPPIVEDPELIKLENELKELQETARRSTTEAKLTIVAELKNDVDNVQNEIEKSMLVGLDSLDSGSLRIRVAQLAAEMKSRTKWEAMRLMDALKKVEQEANAKSKDMLEYQDKLHTEILKRELRLKEETLTSNKEFEMKKMKQRIAKMAKEQMISDLRKIENEYQQKWKEEMSAIQEAMNNEYTTKVTQLEESQRVEQTERMETLAELSLQVKALHAVLDSRAVYEAFSHQVHKVSVAAMALANRVESSHPLYDELNLLRDAGAGDTLIESVLQSLPTSLSNQGAPTLMQLEYRFKNVRKAGRQAALVPKDSGVLGHVLGSVTALLTLAPQGPVEGNDAEAIFSRTAHYLEAGDLASAVHEIEALTDYPAEVASDWLTEAKSRLLVEQAVDVVKAHVSLLAASCS